MGNAITAARAVLRLVDLRIYTRRLLDRLNLGDLTHAIDAIETLESYLGIDPHVMEYERTDIALESFTRSISRVVLPLHQIAVNQGFPTWVPSSIPA